MFESCVVSDGNQTFAAGVHAVKGLRVVLFLMVTKPRFAAEWIAPCLRVVLFLMVTKQYT